MLWGNGHIPVQITQRSIPQIREVNNESDQCERWKDLWVKQKARKKWADQVRFTPIIGFAPKFVEGQEQRDRVLAEDNIKQGQKYWISEKRAHEQYDEVQKLAQRSPNRLPSTECWNKWHFINVHR